MKPALLVNPPLGAFEARLQETYAIAHWPLDAEGAGAIQAALVIGSVGLANEVIENLPNMKLISCLGAGYDGVDVGFATSRGIAVTNCPNINHEDVADLAMGLMLSAARNIAAGDRAVRAGRWRDGLIGTRRFSGRKLAVLGLGAIGRAIANRAAGFRMEIAWTGPRAKPDAPYRYEPDLVALAQWADILVAACPATPETEKIVNAEVLAALGTEGLFVNIARGSVVDEAALAHALQSGALGAAALDVFAEEPTDPALWTRFENVTLTPHIGGATREALREASMHALENLRRHFAGEPLLSPV